MFQQRQMARQLVVAAAIDDNERVRFLIEERRLPVDSTFDGKPSALCYAAIKGNHALAEYLLDRGADSNFRDALGQTPLIYAALGGNAEIIRCLLRNGANPERSSQSGETALSLAWKKNSRCCVAALTGQTRLH